MKFWSTFAVGVCVIIWTVIATLGVAQPPNTGCPTPAPPQLPPGLVEVPGPPGGVELPPDAPFTIRWFVRAYDVDVLLIRYHGRGEKAFNDASMLTRRMREAFGVGRTVCYPDSYVPVVVAANRMPELQQLLGDEMCPLTPTLEWNPHGRAQGSPGSPPGTTSGGILPGPTQPSGPSDRPAHPGGQN